ncbi:MAG TPA: DUF418 domain-containing protein [Povalibacter sp.]
MPHIEKPDRIDIVDALRGFALLGLFLIHSIEYFELYWRNPEPSVVHDVMFFLFGGKAYAVFAMLFGLSFFIIMDRQARRGVDFSGRFLWRLTLLLAMGYLHGLLYDGDVLQVLAVFGFILVIVNRFSNRVVLILSLLCIAQLPMIYEYITAVNGQAGTPPLHAILFPQAMDVFANGTLGEVLRFNAWDGQLGKWSFMLDSGRLMQLSGMFMWGLLLGRIGFFVHPDQYRKQRHWGLALTLIAAIVFYVLKVRVQPLAQLFDNYFSAALVAFGVLLFTEAYEAAPLRRLMNLLTPGGRMSLTMYISQAVLCVPMYYGFGLGLYATIGQVNALILGIVMFGLQLVFARWWLKHYHYGPLEWVWRSATYLTWKVPLRRAVAA